MQTILKTAEPEESREIGEWEEGPGIYIYIYHKLEEEESLMREEVGL